MSYEITTIKRFGGLQASSDPIEVGLDNAVDLGNVEFAVDRSRVKTRPGATLIGSEHALAGTPEDLAILTASGVDYVIAAGFDGVNVFVDRMTAAGVYTAIGTYAIGVASSCPVNIVPYGSLTTQRAFIARDGTLMQYTDGATLTASVGRPRYLGVTANSNRLIQAGFQAAAYSPTGANGDESAVFFSDAGAPTTFGANNYVLLDPGDSEKIHGVATWGTQTFVFKESRVYVFYGESVSSTGTPVFSYRRETLPTGIMEPALAGAIHRVAAGGRGVYYVGADGVYVTTGGAPVKISEPLNDVFDALTTAGDAFSIATVDDRVFLFINSGQPTHYVLDERNGQWSRWKFGVTDIDYVAPPIAWHRAQPYGRAVIFQSSDSLYRCQEGLTADPTGSIQSFYTSGQGDFGVPGVKTVRATDIWAKVATSGEASFQMAVDGGDLDTAALVPVGTTVVGKGEDRIARRGNRFAWKVATATNTQFELSELTFYTRAPRERGLTS